MLLNVSHDIAALTTRLARIGLCVETAVSESSRGLVTGADVDSVLQKVRVTLTDGTAVDHDKGPVVTSSGNYGTGHVLVTARDRDVGVMVLSASDGLNGVSDDFSALEREAHA
jgi:hypothetical protein